MDKFDIVTELRAYGANVYMLRAADEIERLRVERNFDAIEIADMRKLVDEAIAATLRPLSETSESIRKLHDELNSMRAERDEARRRTNSILTEIDCRIEHGAESNGHLEAIRSLFKEDTNE